MQMDWSLSLHYCQICLNKSIITALPFRRRIGKSLEALLYIIIRKSKKKVQSLNIHLYITFEETHVSQLIIWNKAAAEF